MNPTDPPRKKRWRLLGCLVRGPLGCMAFLVGLGAVFVVFGPKVLGTRMASLLVEHVDATYAGSLRIDSAWLPSVVGPQEVSGIVLLDPEGKEILRGRIDAPSLASAFDDDPATTWGPVRVHVDSIELVEDEQGRTNLERALAPKETPKRNALSRVESDLDFEGLHALFTIDRIRWSAPPDRSLVLHDVRCDATFDGHKGVVHMQTTGQGTVEGRVADDVRFTWTVDDVCTAPLERTDWSFQLDTDAVPVALLDALLHTLGDLERKFGDEMKSARLHVSGDVEGLRRIDELQIDGERASVRLAARWPRGSDTIVSANGDEADFRLPAGSAQAASLLSRIVPLAYDFTATDAADTTEIALQDFVLPLRGGTEGLRASCSVVSDGSTFRYVDGVRDPLRLDGREPFTGTARFRVENGKLLYENLALGSPGRTVVVNGSYDFDADRYALIVTLPDQSSFEVSGPSASLAIQPTVR